MVRQIGVAAVDPVKLLDSADVDGPQGGDVPLQLSDAAGGLGDALQLNALSLSVRVAELVGLPQPVQDLLFLHGGGGNLVLQLCRRHLQVLEVLVQFLAGAVFGGALRLQGDLLLVQRRQAVPEGLALGGEFFQFRFPPGDLSVGLVDVPLIGPDRLRLLVPVPGQTLRQLPQVGGTADGGLPLGGQSRQIGLLSADLLRQGAGLGQQL